ncbi:MAG: type I restriction-modification system subunit M [Azonexus sp.]|jgi:type I restriction enzyme M protein|nr:type I restriction-modification system subunit M [Azonexus sp.]
MNASSLVQKIWSFCHTLRDDGVGYGDYLEQLTYLLFLKLAHEYTQEPYNRDTHIPAGYDWASLCSRTGEPLEVHYLNVLRVLGNEPGMLGAIFFKAQNKIQDPAKLARLVQMIDGEKWIGIDADIKGDLYEGLLQKNAEDTKSGAGQYFTPRALIDAMVACVRPEPMKTIADPACGTGGFFLGTYKWLTRPEARLDKRQKAFLRDATFFGNEIVPNTRRLCLMNLFLHNIGELDGEPAVGRSDALIAEPKTRADYVLANPPFGKKSSMTITNEEGEEDRDALTYERQDFWETTSNKQLNFLQHIVSLLKVNGKAAVVLPDNVLFEGGAGEKIRRKLLETCDVHTILRLPTGIFYAQGVKANVVFFDNAPKDGRVHTQGIWFYDLRTNMRFTLKTRPLKLSDLQDFITCYHPENRHERQERQARERKEAERRNLERKKLGQKELPLKPERFRFYPYEDLIARDKASLDIFWLKDENLDNLNDLPPPDVLQQEIIEHLEAALVAFRDVAAALPKSSA